MKDNKLNQEELKDLVNRSQKNYEVERKFILNELPKEVIQNSTITEITQYYILNDAYDTNHMSMTRVRKIIDTDNNITYIQTIKNPIGSDFAVSETETFLTKDEFDYFVNISDSSISKKRYTLTIDDNKWEIDKFHELDIIIAELEKIGTNLDNAIELEKEIMDIKIPISLQSYISEEVTGKLEWSNKNLSLKVKEKLAK